jgi:hypothetical protein
MILDNISQLFYKNEDFALRSVDNNIDIININDTVCIDKNSQEFYDFILIKNLDDKSHLKYIGIILDMIDDLHFYIIPNFRGKNYLHRLINTSILPFLSCYKNRKKQRLSFEDVKVKNYFIKEFNFKSIGKLEVEKDLDSDDIELYNGKDERSILLTDELKEEMKNNLNDAILKIRMLDRQLSYTNYDTFDYDKNYLNDIYEKIKDEISGNC